MDLGSILIVVAIPNRCFNDLFFLAKFDGLLFPPSSRRGNNDLQPTTPFGFSPLGFTVLTFGSHANSMDPPRTKTRSIHIGPKSVTLISQNPEMGDHTSVARFCEKKKSKPQISALAFCKSMVPPEIRALVGCWFPIRPK